MGFFARTVSCGDWRWQQMRIVVEKCAKPMEGLHLFGTQFVMHNVRIGGIDGADFTHSLVGLFRIESKTRHPPVSYQPSQKQLLTRSHFFTSCWNRLTQPSMVFEISFSFGRICCQMFHPLMTDVAYVSIFTRSNRLHKRMIVYVRRKGSASDSVNTFLRFIKFERVSSFHKFPRPFKSIQS